MGGCQARWRMWQRCWRRAASCASTTSRTSRRPCSGACPPQCWGFEDERDYSLWCSLPRWERLLADAGFEQARAPQGLLSNPALSWALRHVLHPGALVRTCRPLSCADRGRVCAGDGAQGRDRRQCAVPVPQGRPQAGRAAAVPLRAALRGHRDCAPLENIRCKKDACQPLIGCAASDIARPRHIEAAQALQQCLLNAGCSPPICMVTLAVVQSVA